MSTAALGSSRECPRCTRRIPDWSPVHLRCLLFRVRYVVAPFVVAACVVLAHVVVIPSLQHSYGEIQQRLIARREAAARDEAADQLAKANKAASWGGQGKPSTLADVAATGPRPTEYALRFLSGDVAVCTIPAGTRVGYALFSGDDTVQVGTATLPDGVCPQVEARRFRIFTGPQVRNGPEEARVKAGTFLLTQTTRAVTYGRATDGCAIPEKTQVVLLKSSIPENPRSTDPREVYLPAGMCPRIMGVAVRIPWDALALAQVSSEGPQFAHDGSPGSVPASEPQAPRRPIDCLPITGFGDSLVFTGRIDDKPSPPAAIMILTQNHLGHTGDCEISAAQMSTLAGRVNAGGMSEIFRARAALRLFEHDHSRQQEVQVSQSLPPQGRSWALTLIEGEVSALSPEGWPVINGHVLRLQGVSTVAPTQMDRFNKWLQNSGNYLECEPRSDGTVYRCLTRGKRDLAEVMLLNGVATAEGTAEAVYRDAMLSAMQARRGQWEQANKEAAP